LTTKPPEARVTAAYRLPAWLHAAVKIDAALLGVQPHKLVETVLTKGVSVEARRNAREPEPTRN